MEAHLREENSQRLITQLGDEIGKFHDIISQERRIREENHSIMVKSIQEAHQRVVMELHKDIAERRQNEENLLHLLEETCLRVERTVLSGN